MITDDFLEEYKQNGVVVIENVFDHDEIKELRNKFHHYLKLLGVNHDKIITGEEIMADEPRIKSKASNIFY